MICAWKTGRCKLRCFTPAPWRICALNTMCEAYRFWFFTRAWLSFSEFSRGCNGWQRMGWVGQTHVSCLQLVSWLPKSQQLTPCLVLRIKLPSNANPQSENLWKRYMSNEQLEDLNPEIATRKEHLNSFGISGLYVCKLFFSTRLCALLVLEVNEWALSGCNELVIIFCRLRIHDSLIEWQSFGMAKKSFQHAFFPPVSKVCFELVVWAPFYSLKRNLADTYWRRLDKCFTSDCSIQLLQQHTPFILFLS